MKVTKKATYTKHYLKTKPLLTQTKGLLRHFDLQARKSLGQHFLIDEEVLKLITSAAELAPTDVIIEIGLDEGYKVNYTMKNTDIYIERILVFHEEKYMMLTEVHGMLRGFPLSYSTKTPSPLPGKQNFVLLIPKQQKSGFPRTLQLKKGQPRLCQRLPAGW